MSKPTHCDQHSLIGVKFLPLSNNKGCPITHQTASPVYYRFRYVLI
ncbi:MAG: hypothetical protein SOY26_06715 [Paludibacteraceae bacterium]|nr:hypothetical protein [Bacteroidales bacterium]MDY4149420.1 hypothetical protein [Paludibacteraceae bacterium]